MPTNNGFPWFKVAQDFVHPQYEAESENLRNRLGVPQSTWFQVLFLEGVCPCMKNKKRRQSVAVKQPEVFGRNPDLALPSFKCSGESFKVDMWDGCAGVKLSHCFLIGRPLRKYPKSSPLEIRSGTKCVMKEWNGFMNFSRNHAIGQHLQYPFGASGHRGARKKSGTNSMDWKLLPCGKSLWLKGGRQNGEWLTFQTTQEGSLKEGDNLFRFLLGNILHFCLLWFSGKSPLNC